MLVNFKIKNYRLFENEISLSFESDMRTKKFDYNTVNINGANLLKVSGIYGPNNTGKTCLLLALGSIRNIMLNEQTESFNNSFNDNTVTEMEVEYIINNNSYKYFVKYDSVKREYLTESLDEKRNNSYTTIMKKREDGLFIRTSDRLSKVEKQYYSNNYPIFMIFNFENTIIEKAQKDYLSFANSIELLRMDSPINISNTINLLKNDAEARKFIKSFIKNCDLNIEDFGYSEDIVSDVDITQKLQIANMYNINKESLKIWSKHHGYIVPSAFYDSIGTQKIIALSGHIYDALKNGKILLIDEIDSSLHHVMARAIIALFNNELNTKTQLIFSTHDALLMDLRRLFRKEQIWLTDMDEKGNAKLIHLSEEFKSRSENGIRGDENITDYYLKGRFGGVPTPDLFDTLYGLEKGESNEEEYPNIS